MKTRSALLLVLAVYLAHQDFWLFRRATPLAFGFLPVGLTYHVLYSIAAALLMWLLVKRAWPHHLDGALSPSAGRAIASPGASVGVGPHELIDGA